MKIFSNHISESKLVKNILQHIETKKNFKLRDSYTYIFNNTHIVKIPFTPQAVKSLQQEIKISKILQKHQLPAQTVAWQQINLSSTPSLNIPFCAVSQRIEGYHPSSLEDPLLQSDLGRFFAKLHKISASEFQDVSTYMDTLFQHTIHTWEQLNKHKGIDKTKWKHFKQHLKSTVLKRANNIFIQDINPVLTHADLHPQNVLVNANNRLIAVLDFGNATITPTPEDIIRFNTFMQKNTPFKNAYQVYSGKRLEEQTKQEKTWKLASQMNKCAESLLIKFLTREKERG